VGVDMDSSIYLCSNPNTACVVLDVSHYQGIHHIAITAKDEKMFMTRSQQQAQIKPKKTSKIAARKENMELVLTLTLGVVGEIGVAVHPVGLE
jgi:hypothetical protein